MIAKLELDTHNTFTFDVESKSEAYTNAVEICEEFKSGGVLLIDEQEYMEFDFSDRLTCTFIYNFYNKYK